MEHPKQTDIDAFNASVASLKVLSKLILSSLPVSDSSAFFEFSFYEALQHLENSQLVLKGLSGGFAQPPALSSGVVGQGASIFESHVIDCLDEHCLGCTGASVSVYVNPSRC